MANQERMSIVKKTQKSAAEYLLRKEHALIKRKVKASSLETADTIALLFDATNAEEFEIIKKFIKKFKESKKKVRALGYYDAKEIPVMMPSKLEYDFFTRKQLKWYLKPSDPVVDNFIKEPFELLINLSKDHRTPLLYVLALSRASFKVGASHPKYLNYYDFIIDLPEETSLTEYLNVLEKYLTMIQPA